VKLIPAAFSGNPKELRSFIEGLEAAHEVVHPRKHVLLLKFIEIKNHRRSKRSIISKGRNVKAILEENYLVKRTLEYYFRLSKIRMNQ